MRHTVAVLVLALVFIASGCATAQETLDLSEQVTERTQWYLVGTDAALGAMADYVITHPEIESIPVKFPDGTDAVVSVPREEVLQKIAALRRQIKPLMESLVRLNTAIQKGKTFADYLTTLLALSNPKEIVKKLLPGVQSKVETILTE